MTERKFKRILHSKPYLMDSLFVRSRYEAQQMVLDSALTIEQVLQTIRRDSDIPAAIWAQIDLVLKAKERKERFRSAIKVWFRELNKGVKTHRRIVAVAVAAVLVIAFFTLIPSGRSLAKGAFDYFMSVFENHIKVKPTDQTSQYPTYIADVSENSKEVVNEYGDEITEFESLDDFTDEFRLVPIRLVSEKFDCAQITLTEYEASGISLSAHYTSAEGDIVITQKWLMSDNISAHSNSDTWESVIILGNAELLYAIDKVDGVFDGFAILNESFLWISAQSSVDILQELPNLTQ
ncbi:MAG: hypothetical protein ABFD11_08420 [Christensenella sp.]